jgi:hypothetical protein
MRAVSTVLDTLVFLLLVSGAVVLLTGSHAQPTRSTTAHDTADVIGSSTVTVSYSPGANGSDTTTASGTLAELLAAAAVANASLDSTELTGSTDGFEHAVMTAVASQVSHGTATTQVTATWEPYPNASLRGTVTAGPTPPADAEIHAATLVVPSGLAPVGTDDGDSVGEVASAVATSVIGGLFPPRQTRMALATDGETASATRAHYRSVAAALGTGLNGSLASNDATAANERLESGLETHLEDDLTSRYDTSAAAAGAVRVDTVYITVRTWSA